MAQNRFIFLVAWLLGFVFFQNQARGADFDQAEAAGPLRVWRSADGLPFDSVTAIIQTRDGFLWVGTSAGFVRFDGVKFTVVKLTEGATNSPSHVTALCEDSDGYLWIGTQQDGLFQLVQGRMRHYTMGQGLLDNDITSLAADKQGEVWVGTKSGLNLWTGETFRSFTTHDGLQDKFVSGVNVARSGKIWITTRTGMCQFADGKIVPYAFQTESQGRSPEFLGAYEDRRGNLWAYGDSYLINLTEGKRFNYFRSSESASVRIWSLCEGLDGRLWIGTSGRGLFCFEDGRFQPVTLGESSWSYDVRTIYEDREGNLWLGTFGGGLVQLRPQSIHVVRVKEGLPTGTPTALALDKKGRIYVAIQRSGLFVGEAGRFDRVIGSTELAKQNCITSVAVTPDGTAWAGTSSDGIFALRNGRELHLTTANGLADDNVLAVCVDNLGTAWASTGNGTIIHLDGRGMTNFGIAHGLPGTPVTAMIPSSVGGLWLGTQNGRILREEKGRFISIETSKNLEGSPVLSLFEGDQKRLWIGTSGGGLTCLVKGAMVNWNTNNGLPNSVVVGVAEDPVKNLWLATGVGIYRVTHSDIVQIIANPGLPLTAKLMSDAKTAPDFVTASGGDRVVVTPGGELWFATFDEMLSVNARQSEIVPSVFPVYIESVVFNDRLPASLLQGALWPPATNEMASSRAPVDLRTTEIYFAALSYVGSEEIHFRHKLEGYDLDWVDDGLNRSARYGKLPYGQYRFRVAARNSDGDWQEAANAFSFVAQAPIYFRTWAILLYVLLVIALVTGIVRLVSHRRLRVTLARLEQQQSLERERMRIARDMHDEMGSKLTKISFLSEHAQVDAPSTGPLADKIESIAQTSRDLLKTMDEIVWVVNPRNDTLENLTAYLSHYAIEYFQNTSIECEMRLPREIPSHPLSSETRHNLFLTFEEALNNILKHSLATKVKVEMTVDSREFGLKIIDNGKGLGTPAPPMANARTRGGNGFKNMKQRLAAIGGECRFSCGIDGGATVVMRLPLSRKGTEKS